jgi:beta-lactamase regulating signal transducer with metallopeptidase domain
MSIALTLLIVVLLITVLGLAIVELVFKNNPGWQDFACRMTLAATLVVPATLLFAGLVIPNGLIKLPILKSDEQPFDSAALAEPAGWKEASTKADLKSTNELPTRLLTAGSVADASRYERQGIRQRTSPISQPQTIVKSGIAEENLAVSTAVADSKSFVWNKSSWAGLLFASWAIGSGLWLVYFAVGALGLRKIKRSAVLLTSEPWNEIANQIASDLNLKRPLCIVSSANVSTPLVAGVLDPTILIPSSLVTETKAMNENKHQIEAILGHEAMHIRRRDTAWNLLSCFVLILWWPVPPVHWMRKRLAWVRELLCDANAVKRVGAADYAEALLVMATVPMQKRFGVLTLSMQPSARALENRVRWILDRSLSAAGVPGNTMQRLAWCCLTLVLAVSTTVRLVPADFATSSSENSVVPADFETSNSENAVVQEEKPHVRGKVHKNENTPVVGATVYLVKYSGKQQYWPMPADFVSRTTDADGAYDFDDVEPGWYLLWAEGDGLTSMTKFRRGIRVNVVAGSYREPVNMKLLEGCNYEVKVLSAVDNTPIENAEVTFFDSDIERTYQTDATGTAKIKGLCQLAWHFVVKADGFAIASNKTAVQELGSTTEIKFPLSPGASVNGKLLDQNEDPVAHAEVVFYSGKSMRTPNFGKVHTNMAGEYEFAGLPMNEKVFVWSKPDGYKHQSQEIVLTDSAVSTNVNLVCEKLTYGGDAVITVLSEDGTPVEGAEVVNHSYSSFDVRTATTDSDGNARLVNMSKYRDRCHFVIRAKGKVPTHFEIEPGSEGNPATQKVTLANGKTLRGQLLTPEGKPAARVAIFLYNVHTHSNDPQDRKWPRVFTDAQGKFESHQLEGDTELSVYGPGNCAPIKGFPVEFDGDEAEVTIKMEPAARIRIRAIDSETGDPIPAFNIKLSAIEPRNRLDGDPSMNYRFFRPGDPGINVHGTKKEFVLVGQTPNAVCGAIVSAEGYEPATIKRLRCKVDAELRDVKLVKSTDE